MSASNVPEVRFDNEMGIPIYPRPVAKHAVLVKVPLTLDGSELPSYILAEWKQTQYFFGDFYEIIVDGVVVYGSAKVQWENMHSLIRPGWWVKTAVPQAYQTDKPVRIVTLIPRDDGSLREANYVLEPGDWVVRQPGGEVQHVKAAKYDGIYFSQEEAVALGLTKMSAEEFADWAVAQVRELAYAG